MLWLLATGPSVLRKYPRLLIRLSVISVDNDTGVEVVKLQELSKTVLTVLLLTERKSMYPHL